MNENTKESKFLDAINKYAEHQKAQITQEIEDYKNTKIEQATEQGLQDAYELIRDDIATRKAAIVNKIAREELRMRNELFTERSRICNDVFRAAEEKLRVFRKSSDYTAFLERSLQQFKERFGEDDCIVYLSPDDETIRPLVTKFLPDARVETDGQIRIGGLKAYCPAQRIMMDDTLDTRLDEQRAWFTENSGLKVV